MSVDKPMSDAGYTLAESLAAMAVIGMAMGALAQAVPLLERLQSTTSKLLSDGADSRSAQVLVAGLLARGQPFGTQAADQFNGGPQAFTFDCAAGENCRVSVDESRDKPRLLVANGQGAERAVDLSPTADYRFIYQGRLSAADSWPPQDPGRQNLRAVSLVGGSGGTERLVFSARVWAEQPADCAYDPVIEDCR